MLRFLRAADFAVRRRGDREVAVESPYREDEHKARHDLELRLATWHAMSGGVHVELIVGDAYSP